MERIERRDTGSARVPLRGIPVELGDDVLPGGFEADALDLGPGGVGLRSAFLPKIGSRLSCRFRNPEDGTPIEARGEVVWADESGPHEGAFGLRFESLDGRSADELDRLIGKVAGSGLGGGVVRVSGASLEAAPDEALEASTGEDLDEASPAEPRLVQIELDGVAQALMAELVHESGDVVLLEQSLDFLTLERRVKLEDGRTGLVAAVDLRVDGETPRLVMTLSIDGEASTPAAARPAEPIAPARPEPRAPVAHPAEMAPEVEPALADAPEAPVLEAAEPHVAAWVDRPSERQAPEKKPADVLREGLEQLGPHLVKLKALWLAFVAKALPMAERLLTTLRAQVRALASRLFSAARTATTRGASRAKRFGDALPRAIAEKRGDVRLPARRPARRQTSSRVPLEARTRSRTQLVVGIGVAFLLLFGIGLLVDGDEPAAATGVEPGAAQGETVVAEVERSSRAYGAAEVPNAMIFDLILESPAPSLEGGEIEDGLVVRIPGGRSVSRAGAIAANHPDVEYAAIRNLDGAAELEIRFVPGRRPAHRVELRGTIVRVSLAP